MLLDEDKVIDIAELFKVFSDSTRIKIISALIGKELCVNDIADLTNTSQSAISHQLRLLKRSKLVKYRKEGKQVYYKLQDEHIEGIIKMALAHIKEGEE